MNKAAKRSRLPKRRNGLLSEPQRHHNLHGETYPPFAYPLWKEPKNRNLTGLNCTALTRATTPSSGSGNESGMRASSKEITVPKIKGNRNTENRSLGYPPFPLVLRNGAREQDGEARIVQPAGVSVERGEEKRQPLRQMTGQSDRSICASGTGLVQ
jgi:hypothetical protein